MFFFRHAAKIERPASIQKPPWFSLGLWEGRQGQNNLLFNSTEFTLTRLVCLQEIEGGERVRLPCLFLNFPCLIDLLLCLIMKTRWNSKNPFLNKSGYKSGLTCELGGINLLWGYFYTWLLIGFPRSILGLTTALPRSCPGVSFE